jgi:BRCT domain type II-containing protein
MKRHHKRSMHKRAAKKAHKRTAKKAHKKSTRGYRKGSRSKTMRGKKDFSTKKSSKVFNRRRHYQKHAKGSRVIRRPYHKK